jgi:ABC-2 type transport system permease protein
MSLATVHDSPPRDGRRMISVDAESRAFLRLRYALVLSTLWTMAQAARLRVGLVVVLSLLFWGSLFGLFHEAFLFLASLHVDVISLLFNAFFSSLMVMLVFSSGILTYSSLYASREARLLLTLPIRPDAIFAHKFQEAMWFSCWGFVLLGSPMLVAYGVVHESSWVYYALILPFMLAFVVIPVTLGSMLCIGLVAWLPRLRVHAVSLAVLLAVAGGGWLAWSAFTTAPGDRISGAWFERTFSRLSFTEQRFLPSWWLASGLIECGTAGEGADATAAFLEAAGFLAVLLANGLLLQMVATWMACCWYCLGYSSLNGEHAYRRSPRGGWLDRLICECGSRQGRPLRLLFVKDLRLFRRDISQWSQFLIFFGLLGLYFINIRSFHYNNVYASMIGFLNLAVVGLILSTFTTRFVFPMISLEGRRFWVLGLLPVRRDHIVWSKFFFAFLGGLPPCCLLVFLSDHMLGIPRSLLLIHELCCVMLCLGLSGISVGLGARMPEMRETSPSKIAAGFGGTLSLVVSSLFIMLVVVIAALPTHLYLATRSLAADSDAVNFFRWLGSPEGVTVSLVSVVVLGLLAAAVPMTLGLRHFRRLEIA